MAVMDEFKEERANLKNKPLSKRIGYFWMYYKWYVIVSAVAAFAIVATVHSIVTQKEDILFGVTLNGGETPHAPAYLADFAEYAGIDTEEYDVFVNSTLVMSQRGDSASRGAAEFITVYSFAGDLDFITMDAWAFTHYAYNNIFTDLSTLFSAEELEALDGMIYYMDAATHREILQLQDAGKSADHVSLPDPFKPEDMKEPVPIGIDISQCEDFHNAYYYQDSIAYLGIPQTTTNTDMAVKFAKYILGW